MKTREVIPVVFISGPFRAPSAWEIEQNVRRAEAAALEVWRAGCAAFCPHTNTRFFQGAAPDDVWLAGDLAILIKCDALLAIDGWRESEGARAEVQLAGLRGIPVYESMEGFLGDLRRLREKIVLSQPWW